MIEPIDLHMDGAKLARAIMPSLVETIQNTLFDYGSLDSDIRAFVQEQEAELDYVLKRTSEEIGAILLKVKQRLPHGKYMPWLASRGMSQQTAWRCMQLAQGKEIKKSPILSDLPVSKPEEYTPPDATSLLLQGTQVAQEAYNAVIEDRPFIISPDPDRIEPRGVPAALQSSDSNEWYTPKEYIEAARELMGGIGLDPASCQKANETVQAASYYDTKINGLEWPWYGGIWLNPPYGFTDGESNQAIWSRRLIEQYKCGNVAEAVLLVNANTEAKWFQPLYDYLICLTNHRIRFYNTTGDASQPTQGNALVYFGENPMQRKKFIELFGKFGTVIERAKIDGC